MERKTAVLIAERYIAGAPVIITFKKDAFMHLRLLMMLHAEGKVRIAAPSVVAAVLLTNDWEMDMNRRVAVTFPINGMKDERFTARVSEGIEQIRFATELPLHCLMTGRQKIQQEHAARIIKECCEGISRKDLDDYGLTFSGKLENISGMPQIVFTLMHEGKVETTIVLDGWSGRIFVNGRGDLVAYRNAKDVHDIVRLKVDEFLERHTAQAAV